MDARYGEGMGFWLLYPHFPMSMRPGTLTDLPDSRLQVSAYTKRHLALIMAQQCLSIFRYDVSQSSLVGAMGWMGVD